MTLPSICADCGTPYEKIKNESRCTDCSTVPTEHPRVSATRSLNKRMADPLKYAPRKNGYTPAWDRLSKQARGLQPWCSDCGTPDDLTADHSTTAWHRYERGLPIRLQDIDVVCRTCNAERGPARGQFASDEFRQIERDEQFSDLVDEYERADEMGLDEMVARGLADPLG